MPLQEIELNSVVHLVRPVGRRANHLEELRQGIAEASRTTLFYHTHGHQLRHPAASELPLDDWSAWVNGVVQDRETAERMSFVVLNRGDSADELRASLLEVLGSLPERTRVTRDAPEEGHFVFLDFESVTVPTGRIVTTSHELMEHLAEANPSVLFYHLIEQPWLDPDAPTLADWVRARGDERLAAWLDEAGRSGRPLEDVRRRLMRRWKQSSIARRVTAAALEPEESRREEARRAVAGFVRRMTGTESVE
jgi:hypothetical protein